MIYDVVMTLTIDHGLLILELLGLLTKNDFIFFEK